MENQKEEEQRVTWNPAWLHLYIHVEFAHYESHSGC